MYKFPESKVMFPMCLSLKFAFYWRHLFKNYESIAKRSSNQMFN